VKDNEKILKQINTTSFIVLFLFIISIIFIDHWIYACVDDDAYYYFTIARNLSSGEGITYCNEPTNGFQPLWLFILSGINYLIGNSQWLVKIGFILGSLFFLLSTIWVYKSARIVFKQKGLSLFTSFIWLTNYFLLIKSGEGLETGLYLLILSIFLFIWLRRIYFNDKTKLKDWIILGIISGLGFLARIDICFILLVIWIASLIKEIRQEKSLIKGSVKIGIGFSIYLVFSLPWVIYNINLWHNPLPVSAYFASESFYSPSTFLKRLYFSLIGLFQMPIYYPINFFIWRLKGFKKIAGIFILIVLLWGIYLARKDKEILNSQEKINFYIIMLISSLIFYTAYLTAKIAYWFLPRYLAPVIFLMIFINAELWYKILSPKRIYVIIFCSIILIGCLWMRMYSILERIDNSERYLRIYRMQNLEWITKNIPKSIILAGFQSGIYNYYLSEKGYIFYNLDGKVSINAYKALKEKRLMNYIKEKRIKYIIDWKIYFDALKKEYKLKDNEIRLIEKLNGDYLVEVIY